MTSKWVFTSNLSTGGTFATVSWEEERALKAAAVAVGDALQALLTKTFRVEPTGPSPL